MATMQTRTQTQTLCRRLRLRPQQLLLQQQLQQLQTQQPQSRTFFTTSKSASNSSPSSDAQDEPPKHRVLILGSGWAGYAFARTLSASPAPSRFSLKSLFSKKTTTTSSPTHPPAVHRTIVSPRSHFVFTPLLASTAVGTLEFRAALEPIRRLGLESFHEGFADHVDFVNKQVWVRPTVRAEDTSAAIQHGSDEVATVDRRKRSYAIPYDSLVIALGSSPQTFNTPGALAHAHLLRTATHARLIRLRLLSLFEHATRPDISLELRRDLLHFAVVGGGPTGVEFAAELHDLVHEDLPRLYPALVGLVRITVYDVAETVLPMFERDLARYATELFRRQGIEVRTGSMIQGILKAGEVLGEDHPLYRTQQSLEPDKPAEKEIGLLRLQIKEKSADRAVHIPAGMVVWSTGLAPNPLLARLGGLRLDAKTGGIVVDERLRVLRKNDGGDDAETTDEVIPDVYAIGDCSVVSGRRYPATAQVASQQAIYLGRQFNKRLSSESSSSSSEDTPSSPVAPRPFHFRNLGVMAYLGSWRAIHQSGADELKGRAAWLLWRTAYLTKSMSLRNKIMVVVHWLTTWAFGRDISRF